MIVLGIETSCDETAAAIINEQGHILAEEVYSQHALHQRYGGVVPEIASRNHLEHLAPMVQRVMQTAGLSYSDLSAIAATAGPGLIGGVLVGMMLAKGIAAASNKPFLAINHLEAHALTARINHNLPFPFLLFLLSGGHCQILQVEGVGQYTLYGQTLDDAIGESFDKVGRMLGLPYPGGPAVEIAAQKGNLGRFRLPQPLAKSDTMDFSLSGLKTAVHRLVKDISPLSAQDVADISATFQHTIANIINVRMKAAISKFKQQYPTLDSVNIVLAGGVAANSFLKQKIQEHLRDSSCQLIVPPARLCTDNAVMIAWAGIEKLQLGKEDSLAAIPRSRWPLG